MIGVPDISTSTRQLEWPILAILLVAIGPTARGQDLDEPDDPPVVQNAAIDESNFDRWVFGNVGGNDLTARDRLGSLLTLSIDEADRACKLTEPQKKKLRLAGHGDLKRFLERVEEARRVFRQLNHDQNNINQIYQETVPLSATLRTGLFGDDSFFGKTLRTTLDPEQSARYRESLDEKLRFRYRAKVGLAVANLDAAVGFTAEQRRRLIELTLQETKPPVRAAANYENYLILYKISRLPEDKIKPLFDDARWRDLNRQLTQSRNMEQFLKANGYLDEDEPSKSGEKKDD
jgi:hypothetical protein